MLIPKSLKTGFRKIMVNCIAYKMQPIDLEVTRMSPILGGEAAEGKDVHLSFPDFSLFWSNTARSHNLKMLMLLV